MSGIAVLPVMAFQDLETLSNRLGHEDLATIMRMPLPDLLREILEHDGTPQWMIDILTLSRYWRVTFNRRETAEKFIVHFNTYAEQKENCNFTEAQMKVMKRSFRDVARFIARNLVECLDDSHWPVGEQYLVSFINTLEIFPQFDNDDCQAVVAFRKLIVETREEVEDGLEFLNTLRRHNQPPPPRDPIVYIDEEPPTTTSFHSSRYSPTYSTHSSYSPYTPPYQSPDSPPYSPLPNTSEEVIHLENDFDSEYIVID